VARLELATLLLHQAAEEAAAAVCCFFARDCRRRFDVARKRFTD